MSPFARAAFVIFFAVVLTAVRGGKILGDLLRGLAGGAPAVTPAMRGVSTA